METSIRWPERFLTREQQFCNLCVGTGLGYVRIANEADMVALRVGRSEPAARKAYRARRRRALMRHLRAAHPQVLAGPQEHKR